MLRSPSSKQTKKKFWPTVRALDPNSRTCAAGCVRCAASVSARLAAAVVAGAAVAAPVSQDGSGERIRSTEPLLLPCRGLSRFQHPEKKRPSRGTGRYESSTATVSFPVAFQESCKLCLSTFGRRDPTTTLHTRTHALSLSLLFALLRPPTGGSHPLLHTTFPSHRRSDSFAQ